MSFCVIKCEDNVNDVDSIRLVIKLCIVLKMDIGRSFIAYYWVCCEFFNTVMRMVFNNYEVVLFDSLVT